MPYISVAFKGEDNIFDLNVVSLRRLPLKDGHWTINKGIRRFCEKFYIYIINDPDGRRFDVPITGIRLFADLEELVSYLNGEAPPLFKQLKSSVKEKDWPEAPSNISEKSSLPMNHPQYLSKQEI